MCGIAGLLGIDPDLARGAAERMTSALRHRGPDDRGSVAAADPRGLGPPAVLVQTRLAILDLSPAGHQPMADEGANGARNWIVFNGEIFNYEEFHGPLAREGSPCRSRSDTEVILRAWRLWGESCVDSFRGMFAWCLLDSDRGTAWFCRDRLGVKPLYFHRPRSGGLLFASEVRALLAAGPELVPARIDPVALESFLAQGAVCGSRAIIDGVELLGPGETLTTDWSGNRLKSRRYWSLPFAAEQAPDRAIDRPSAVDRIGTVLREAVRLRLIADVPLGLFLSGGIDSGALTAIATEVAGTTVETISIGFDQPEFDETVAAAAVSRALGTRHRVVRLSGQNLLDEMPAALSAIDQPTVDGFNTYFVSQAARRSGLTVALSGLGGDELFGGYASFHDVPRALRVRRQWRWAGPLKLALAGAARASGGRRGIKAAAMFDREPSPVQMYLLRRELFLPQERRALQPLPDDSDSTSGLSLAGLEELGTTAPDADLTNQISSFELAGYMRHMLLRDADVFSMAHGLEVRVPLLDHKLVETVAALPGVWKRPDPRSKPLLIDAVGPRLPDLVHQSPKRGFTFPWDAWLRGPLRDRAQNAMETRTIWNDLGLESEAPARLWNLFLRRDPRVAALQILGLAVLGDYAAKHRLTRT